MTTPIDDYLTPTLWQDGWPDRSTMKEQDEFLFAIWGPQVQDYTETFGSLCFRKKAGGRDSMGTPSSRLATSSQLGGVRNHRR